MMTTAEGPRPRHSPRIRSSIGDASSGAEDEQLLHPQRRTAAAAAMRRSGHSGLWRLLGWLGCGIVGGLALLLLQLFLAPWCSSLSSPSSTVGLLCLALFPPHLPSPPPPPPSLLVLLPSASLLPCSPALLRDDLHYLSSSEHVELLRSAGLLPPVPEPRLLVVGMSGSAKGRERMRTAMDTWLRNLSSRAIFFSDVDEPDLRMVSLPSMRERTGYRDAQHRQLRGLRWLLQTTQPTTLLNGSVFAEPYEATDLDHQATVSDKVATRLQAEAVRGEVDWLLFADDDTFVNAPALLSLLREQWHSAHLPLIIGNVFDRVTRNFDSTYCVGGAGFVMSAPAARIIARALYTPACPFIEFNDDSIGDCATRMNVTAVHNALFQNGLDFQYFRYLEMKALKMTAITWHYAADGAARDLQWHIDHRQEALSKCKAALQPPP